VPRGLHYWVFGFSKRLYTLSNGPESSRAIKKSEKPIRKQSSQGRPFFDYEHRRGLNYGHRSLAVRHSRRSRAAGSSPNQRRQMGGGYFPVSRRVMKPKAVNGTLLHRGTSPGGPLGLLINNSNHRRESRPAGP
jgi:hypothetical protein